MSLPVKAAIVLSCVVAIMHQGSSSKNPLCSSAMKRPRVEVPDGLEDILLMEEKLVLMDERVSQMVEKTHSWTVKPDADCARKIENSIGKFEGSGADAGMDHRGARKTNGWCLHAHLDKDAKVYSISGNELPGPPGPSG